MLLKINEIQQQHVGKGRAIIDPKIIEEQNWNVGQILELTYNKKTYVKLWPASPEEYGAGIIKVDGITRQNIGAALDDKISIKSVEAANAEQITLSPTAIGLVVSRPFSLIFPLILHSKKSLLHLTRYQLPVDLYTIPSKTINLITIYFFLTIITNLVNDICIFKGKN